MSNAEQVSAEVPATKAGGGRGVILILAVALLVVSAVCGYALYTLRSHGAAAEGHAADAKAADKPKGPELYLQLDPAFVVNFQKADSLSYLQVGVTLMAHDPAAIQAAKDADPVIRNALVMLFSSQDYTALVDTAGKQKLQSKALSAVQKIVEDKLGRPGVDALYFTSFVMQ